MSSVDPRTDTHAPAAARRPGVDDAPIGARMTAAGHPLDEYTHLGEDLRHYGVLRLYRLTLLLGTTGAMVTALASEGVRAHPLMLEAIMLGGLAITIAFAVMDFRSGEQWLRMQRRSNLLASALGFATRPVANAWNPLSTTGAGRALHALLVASWLYFLFLVPLR
jgi:hypothetical protein